MSKPKHVYLVDGSGYIFRAFHALPPLTRSDGTHVNAVLGFTNMLLKLLDETDADHRSEEHTSELQSHRDLHSFPTRRSSDLPRAAPADALGRHARQCRARLHQHAAETAGRDRCRP